MGDGANIDSGRAVHCVLIFVRQWPAANRIEDGAREVGVSKHTIYAWKAKYGGMEVSQAQEAKQHRGLFLPLPQTIWPAMTMTSPFSAGGNIQPEPNSR